jgi:hypothetical protein
MPQNKTRRRLKKSASEALDSAETDLLSPQPWRYPAAGPSAGAAAVPHHDISSHINRLDELTRALRREMLLIRQANAPLLYLERMAYLRE